MPQSNTYSTTAVDGSADGFAYTPPQPQTPAQVAANKVLDLQRINNFMADTGLATATVAAYTKHEEYAAGVAEAHCRKAASAIGVAEKLFEEDDMKDSKK
ncbi:hypothetical protein DL95DRAFT_461091 [Leptodontidium sp. 2 PMI_412]|nr:hypothetical protein DL95DRAFT_461091 [Leptodontidium sp. 2 PMI_412]